VQNPYKIIRFSYMKFLRRITPHLLVLPLAFAKRIMSYSDTPNVLIAAWRCDEVSCEINLTEITKRLQRK
jgi:hypothetical protein